MSWPRSPGLTTDEIIRPGTSVETLAGLKPAFYNPAYEARFPQITWEITAGNSSPLSDGSAAVLITTSRGRQAARPAPAGPHPHGDRRRIGPAVHADRRHPGHREGAAPRRASRSPTSTCSRSTRRSRPSCWRGPMTPAPTWRRRTSTVARSRSVTRSAPAARGIMTTMVNALEQRGGRYGLQTMCEARRHGQRHHHRAACNQSRFCARVVVRCLLRP